jgi:hypothetical protein
MPEPFPDQNPHQHFLDGIMHLPLLEGLDRWTCSFDV